MRRWPTLALPPARSRRRRWVISRAKPRPSFDREAVIFEIDGLAWRCYFHDMTALATLLWTVKRVIRAVRVHEAIFDLMDTEERP